MDPSTSAAALRAEIARLTGAIDRFKTTDPQVGSLDRSGGQPRRNVYVNPNYRPQKVTTLAPRPYRQPAPLPAPRLNEKKDVIIGGVAFESSGRTLVRKDLAVTRPAPTVTKPPSFASAHAARFTAPQAPPSGRVYKPKTPRRGRPMNHNMTLTNNRAPKGVRRRKYVDKPCPRFNTTGACNRGLTCVYRHDPAKIAICWPFLQGSCPNTASTCPLSHDPTPERTPLCVHFANAGRCTRANCPFPHVKVGHRDGVCRDFAVLGFCDKGLDCDHQHVRECPDFAEKGICSTKGCKLPHVIRANRNRKDTDMAPATSSNARSPLSSFAPAQSSTVPSPPVVTAEDAQMGDEFISLTFRESDSDDDDDEEDERSDGEEGEANGPDPYADESEDYAYLDDEAVTT